MRILIVAPFCSLPGEPYFNRFLYLAELLSEHHEVTLVTSRFRHFDKTHRQLEFPAAPYKIILIDEPGYRGNVSIRRLWSHHVFLKNFREWFGLLAKGGAYQVVYSAYPLMGTNIALGKLKSAFGFRLIVDVQDVWPESFSSVLAVVKGIPARWLPFSRRADAAYRSADALVAVSQTYLGRAAIANPVAPRIAVYIGSDGESIERARPLELERSGFNVLYMGSLSHSYDVATVVRAFGELQSRFPDIHLHIAGGGPDEQYLRGLARGNVTFHGFLPYPDLLSLAKAVDAFVNPIHSAASQSVTNKLSDYMALGKPILNSQRDPEVLKILDGVVAENYKSGDVGGFVDALLRLRARISADPHGKPGRPEGASAFDRRYSYPKLVEFIEAQGGLNNEARI